LTDRLFGTIWATGPIVVARRSVTGTILGELHQLFAIQFAVAIRVEVHGVFDHPFGRRRTSGTAAWSTVVGRTIIQSLSVARLFAAAGSLGSSTGTDRVAAAIAFKTAARSVRSWSAWTTGSTRSAITGTATIRSGAAVVRTASTAAAAGRSPRGPQFVLRQFAVAVLVELLEGGGSVGDFFGGEDAVMVGIEGFHERIGRPALASAAWRSLRWTSVVVAGRWTLRALFVVALRAPFRRLGNNHHRTERANDADRPKNVSRSKHVDLPAIDSV
jgi:hypothetical protein